MIPKHRRPAHPGEILLKEFLKPLGMSQVALAKKMHETQICFAVAKVRAWTKLRGLTHFFHPCSNQRSSN